MAAHARGAGRAALVRLSTRARATAHPDWQLPVELMAAADRYAACRNRLERLLDAPLPLRVRITGWGWRRFGRPDKARASERNAARTRAEQYQTVVDDMAETLTELHHLTMQAKSHAAQRFTESTAKIRALETKIVQHIAQAMRQGQTQTEAEEAMSALTQELDELRRRTERLEDDIEIARTLGQSAYAQKLTEDGLTLLQEQSARLSGKTALEADLETKRQAALIQDADYQAALVALKRQQTVHQSITTWRSSLGILELRYRQCQQDLLELFKTTTAAQALAGAPAALEALQHTARSTNAVLSEHEDIVFGLTAQVATQDEESSPEPDQVKTWGEALAHIETDWNEHVHRLEGAKAALRRPLAAKP